ncbi:MAG TPA: hypothetical protein VKS21_04540 [Spirochaetota bacterium]|nr:hypothetical protein [Spirochaetota bacterium]
MSDDVKKIFKHKPLSAGNLFHRLFKIKPQANAIIEINNLLATADHINDLSSDQLDAVCRKYKIDIYRKFKNELQHFYKKILTFFLKDKKLSGREINQLKHIKKLFGLQEKTTARMHKEIASALYQKELDAVLQDGKISAAEKEFLRQLEQELQLEPHTAASIYKNTTAAYYRDFQKLLTADQRLSPDEINQLKKLAASLDIPLPDTSLNSDRLNKFKLFWLIENGELPEIKVDIKLKRGEKAYFYTTAEFYKKKTVTRRIRYGGPTARIRIIKGIYWRAGDLGVSRVQQDVIALEDKGDLYLTNKRLIFMGERKNKTIRLNRILDLTPYSDGVEIQKDKGYNPVLAFTRDLDLFCMLLSRAIDEY